MTALTQFDRLEASALWTPPGDAQRRDVVVSLGKASISILDRSETPLAHWSLAAIERQNPGRVPALYRPGADSDEALEIDDALMIGALDRISAAVSRARPRRGRLRVAILGAASLALIGTLVFWLPGAMVRHATAVVPPAVRADTGARLLRELARLTGEPCRNPASRGPLDALARRTLGSGAGQIAVLPSGLDGAVALPGRIVALGRDTIEDHDGPAATAGYVLDALERASREDPIARILDASGPRATLLLLTRGEIPTSAIEAHARRLLEAPAPLAIEAPEGVLARFRTAQVPSTPYAYALDPSGERSLPLIEGDPMAGDDPRPVLTDGQWIALQSICDG
ncbi:hypothetical protein E2L08_16035 [Palleronia sediminis]|uniref:Uncharacterized protein n=1 Tax=Palleronia sediminis TaxID=2547833 RepID=A0A4V3B887_9RHOB|nr:hypothetical protein [Palleronia sediminis]TDL74219.1 hypothetical protein E2L08_16035 [Palleronia sediminis]